MTISTDPTADPSSMQDACRTYNQLIPSIFIPPKIKRHILSYISSWESKNT